MGPWGPHGRACMPDWLGVQGTAGPQEKMGEMGPQGAEDCYI